MKDRIWGMLARRIAVAIASAVALAAIGGSAFAVASHRPPSSENKPVVAASETETPDVQETESPDPAETPGGTVERFHGDGTTPCDLPEGTTLDGNWTHGDFVSAWAESGDHDKTHAAAKSPCGMPQKAVDAKAAHQHGEHGASADHSSHGHDVSSQHKHTGGDDTPEPTESETPEA